MASNRLAKIRYLYQEFYVIFCILYLLTTNPENERGGEPSDKGHKRG